MTPFEVSACDKCFPIYIIKITDQRLPSGSAVGTAG